MLTDNTGLIVGIVAAVVAMVVVIIVSVVVVLYVLKKKNRPVTPDKGKEFEVCKTVVMW